jgi:acetyltransferase-like isoleucine patch superfamily enzyme
MVRIIRDLLWFVLDPVLLSVRSRLEHLERSIPSNAFSYGWERLANYDSTVQFSPGSSLVNLGPRENLVIGSYTGIMGELAIIRPGGALRLGHHCSVGWGSRIWSQSLVEIGNYVLIAHLVDIHDSNSHSLSAEVRREDPIHVFQEHIPMDFSHVETKPIRIEDNVWIGFKSSIMKGVTVGRGAVIAAGSMVTKDVPPFSLVAGNPAQVVRDLTPEGDTSDDEEVHPLLASSRSGNRYA